MILCFQNVDSAVEKASPSIVSAWEKSQPVAKEVRERESR